MQSVAGKVVIITGAASGIGRGSALAFASKGAKVVVADINLEGARKVVEEIVELGGAALAVAIDVGDNQAFGELRDVTVAHFGAIDIVMNNAGVLTRGLPEHIPLEEWQRVININLMSIVRSNSAFLPVFLEQGSGHIVNTASFAGLFSYSFDRLPYVASKAAIIQLSEGLALYLRPKGIGVTVLCPGPVATNIAVGMRTFGPDTQTRGPGAEFAMRDPREVGYEVVEAVLTERFMLTTDDNIAPVLVDRAQDWDGFVDSQIKKMAE